MTQLKPIRLLLTAGGCPGASTCIRYLKGIEERPVEVIAVDADPESSGRFFADDFYVVPTADSTDYIPRILALCKTEAIDCVVVSSSYEIEAYAKHRRQFDTLGVKVLASDYEHLVAANNKKFLYETFKDHPQVKVPEFKVVNSLDEFVQSCEQMGYPRKPLCFKPPHSKGSRGFRFLTESISRKDLLLHHKPVSKYMSLGEMVEIFKEEPDFPELLVMEAVEGEEVDTMVLAHQGEPLIITHKTRERDRGGVITHGGHCKRPVLDEMVAAVLAEVKLSYNVGIQFKGEYLIEINPRLSTFIYSKTWVEPYFAVKLALGELTLAEAKALQAKVPYELRMLRYFDEACYDTASLEQTKRARLCAE